MNSEEVDKKSKKKKKEALVKKVNIEDDDEEAQKANLAQRRGIRSTQNMIRDKIMNLHEELTDISNNETFDGIRELINNETFKEISHVREACKDAEIMRDLSGIVLKRAQKLDDSSKRYNFTAFTGRLKELFSTAATADDDGDDSEEEEDKDEEGGRRKHKRRSPVAGNRSNSNSLLQLNWTRLGADAGQLFYGATPINTLIGPLGAPPKAKKAIVRQDRSDAHAMIAAKPKEVVNDEEEGEDDDEEEGEATRARIRNLGKTLLKMNKSSKSLTLSDRKHKEKWQNRLPFLDVFVDPKDNVQTIENIFDLAFLMKNGDVICATDTSGDPFVICDDSTFTKINGDEKRQHVLSINMKELQELQKLHDGSFDPDAPLRSILENMNDEDDNDEDVHDENTPSKNKKGSKSSSSPSQMKRQSLSASVCVLHRDDQLYQERDVHRQAEIIQEMDEKRMKEKTAARKERKRKERLMQSGSPPKVAKV